VLTTRMVVPVSVSIAFSVGITMAVVYTVGRFQPPTIGHKKLIEGVVAAAREKGGEAYVFVSAAEDPDMNPLSPAQKIPILKHMFPKGVEFVDTKTCLPGKTPCGGPRFALAWFNRMEPPPKDIYLAIGKERVAEFKDPSVWGKDNPLPKEVIPIGEDRDPNDKSLNPDNMSGTKARQLAFDKKKDAFYTAVGYPGEKNVPEVEAIYNRIAEWFPRHLKRKPMSGPEKGQEMREYNKAHPKEGGNDEDTMEESYPSAFAADAEPKQGGRRRTYRRCRKCGLPKKPETQ
jgi:hypothetical protein